MHPTRKRRPPTAMQGGGHVGKLFTPRVGVFVLFLYKHAATYNVIVH